MTIKQQTTNINYPLRNKIVGGKGGIKGDKKNWALNQVAEPQRHKYKKSSDTPLKFNMEPENGGLEDDFPFQLGDS